MRKEVAISGAIIGASFVAAVVIAGGPSGIWPSGPEPVSVVGSETWDVGSETAPTTTAREETDAEPGETDGDLTDGTVVEDGTQVASSSVTVPEATVTQGTVIGGDDGTDDAEEDADDGGLRDRSAARVAVANGAGVAGAAGARASQLAALGYADPVAINAEPFAFTLVYAAEGWEPEAARLAEDAGLPVTAVFPLAEAPALDTTDEFDLVLVLGSG